MFGAATKPIAIATAGNTKAKHINQKGKPVSPFEAVIPTPVAWGLFALGVGLVLYGGVIPGIVWIAQKCRTEQSEK